MDHRNLPVWKAIVMALGVFVLGHANGARANDIANCNQSADPELQIKGCTGFIQSGASGNNLAIAHANRGIAYDALDQMERAIEEFDAAIRVNPDYAIAYYNRGIAWSELGHMGRAIDDFDMAIKINPSDPDAYDARGYALSSLSEYPKAIEDFTTAIDLDPDFAAAYYHRSLAYGRIGELEAGLADYDRALKLGCLRHGWCPAR